MGPTAHVHLTVALLLPDEVGDVEDPGQAVECLVAGSQAVEERRLDPCGCVLFIVRCWALSS